jgi:hypothetical protein
MRAWHMDTVGAYCPTSQGVRGGIDEDLLFRVPALLHTSSSRLHYERTRASTDRVFSAPPWALGWVRNGVNFSRQSYHLEIVKVERCDQIEGEPDLDSFCRHTKPGEELAPESESQILPLYGSGSSGLLSSQSPVHQDLDLCAAVFCPT